jgi:hypothetical protein
VKEGCSMKDENICINRKDINGELICKIIQKPISIKCEECGKRCPNFEQEN